ncbi:MAG: phosphoglycerate dehydrogenase [Verrucomicrobia bacterium]|nr:phosphoglycerate dehydrogenase [Verrucomicrobiota bacterium]
MKILIADKIAESGVAYLREQAGVDVVEAYGSSPEELKAHAADADAIIVRSASTITREIIESASKLRAVGRAGVGIDNIDVDAASDKGVIVMNTPGGNTIATAELAFTHLLCSARPIPQAHSSMKEGQWNKKAFQGSELYEKTLGILGLGRIGSEVARRAKSFGMRVLAYDPYLTAARAEQLEVEKVDLDKVYAEADFLTVHMPKTEATTNLLNATAFAKMKDGVRIINCARGGLVQEEDLAEALKSGKVAAAGLDVFLKEPLADDSPLRDCDRLVMTPHLGASTQEAQENVGLEVAECVLEALRGGWVRNAVNVPSIDPKQLQVLRPYLALAYKLGTVLQQLTPEEISHIRLTYSGKLVNLDVKPLNRAFQKGYLRRITTDVNDVNAPRVMERLGIQGEIVQNNLERDYTELIRAEASDSKGNSWSLEGTLIGKSQSPRLTRVNERNLETPLDEKYLLVVENEDVPGIVGMIGTVLSRYDLNIASMSLGRNTVGGLALNIAGIDSEPKAAALEEIRQHKAIKELRLVHLNGA